MTAAQASLAQILTEAVAATEAPGAAVELAVEAMGVAVAPALAEEAVEAVAE